MTVQRIIGYSLLPLIVPVLVAYWVWAPMVTLVCTIRKWTASDPILRVTYDIGAGAQSCILWSNGFWGMIQLAQPGTPEDAIRSCMVRFPSFLLMEVAEVNLRVPGVSYWAGLIQSGPQQKVIIVLGEGKSWNTRVYDVD